MSLYFHQRSPAFLSGRFYVQVRKQNWPPMNADERK